MKIHWEHKNISAQIQDNEAKLTRMKRRCESEKREPYTSEQNKADSLLDEIDFLKSKLIPESDCKPDPEWHNGMPSGKYNRSTNKMEQKKVFESVGDQLRSIREAGTPGGKVDNRLHEVRAITGLGTATPSEAGFLIQQDFSNEILQTVWNESEIISRCKTYEISGTANSIKIPGFDETARTTGNRQGGIRAFWIAEAGEKQASKPTFRQVELNLKKLVCLCYATDSLLEDAPTLGRVLVDGFKKEIEFMLTDSILNGSGAGQCLGILNAASLVSVGIETGQASNSLVAENLLKMHSRLFASSRKDAIWIYNQNVEPMLHSMSIAVGTGGVPVFMPANGLSGKPYGTLFGIAAVPVEQCQTLGTKGDIYLCDFTNGYALATKGGIKSDMSIYTRFIYDESIFRSVLRVDGSPILGSSVQPFKGGASYAQGHFISLDARA